MMRKKINLNKIVDSIAELVDSDKPLTGADLNDALGQKLKVISESLTTMQAHQEQQVKDLDKVNQLINDVFVDIKSLRNEFETQAETDTAESSKDEKENKE